MMQLTDETEILSGTTYFKPRCQGIPFANITETINHNKKNLKRRD
jgi:hypothetical protein